MVNNTGTTTSKLPRTIGRAIEFNELSGLSSVTIISGELGLGFLLFDEDGTVSVCTETMADEQGNLSYEFTTTTLDTEIDIQDALSQSY